MRNSLIFVMAVYFTALIATNAYEKTVNRLHQEAANRDIKTIYARIN